MKHHPSGTVVRACGLIALALALIGCASSQGADRFSMNRDGSLSGAYLRGRFAAQAFDLPRADEAFEAVAAQRDALPSNRLAFAYAMAAGSMRQAEAQARSIVESDQPPVEGFQAGLQADLPRFMLAAAAVRDGAFDKAETWLDDPMQSPLGRSLATLLRSAVIYEREGLKAATDVLAKQDNKTFRGLVPLHAAGLFLLEGDNRAAEAAFRQALSAPRSNVAALGFARFLEDQGRQDDAAMIYQRMVHDMGLYSRAGRMGLVRTGKLTEQPRAFTRRAQREPAMVTDAASLFALALENYAWLGFEQAAGVPVNNPMGEQARRQALVVPLALANLARYVDGNRDGADYLATLVFNIYGTRDAAIDAADQVPPNAWVYTYAVLEKASAIGRGGPGDEPDLDQAIAVLKDAIRADGGANPAWALQLHIALMAEDRFDEADGYATKAIDMAEALGVVPSALWRYYFARGASRTETGRWEEAKQDLEKALSLRPDESLILNHLGYSYVERGEQLERAFGMIEEALLQDPENGSIVDSLGWAHFQQGRYLEAVEHLEAAVELEPEDAVITDHLGDAYYMLHRERDARFEWQRVPDMRDADDELIASVRRKLARDFSMSPVLAGRASAP